jgi:hypothetical protein
MANIDRIEIFAMQVSLLRVAVVTPNSLGRVVENRPDLTYDKGLSYEFWLEAAIALLKKCDAMILAPGWENSSGVKEEIKVANRLGIPVLYTLAELAYWLKNSDEDHHTQT